MGESEYRILPRHLEEVVGAHTLRQLGNEVIGSPARATDPDIFKFKNLLLINF